MRVPPSPARTVVLYLPAPAQCTPHPRLLPCARPCAPCDHANYTYRYHMSTCLERCPLPLFISRPPPFPLSRSLPPSPSLPPYLAHFCCVSHFGLLWLPGAPIFSEEILCAGCNHCAFPLDCKVSSGHDCCCTGCQADDPLRQLLCARLLLSCCVCLSPCHVGCITVAKHYAYAGSYQSRISH
jgi:hypothetical protein